MKAKYFDRNGDEIDEHHAVDRHGALRDGVTLHIPLQMRYGLTPTQLSVRDAAARDARELAYRLYDQQMGEMYKQHGSMRDLRDSPNLWAQADPRGSSFGSTGFGSSGQRGDQPGDVCTIDGREGRLRVVGGELQCLPLRSDSAAKFHDGTPDGGGNRPGWRLPIGDSRKAQHDALVEYERELTNRWRLGDQERTCSECDGSGEDEAGNDCPVCNGEGVLPAAYETTDTQTAHASLAQRNDDSRPLAQRIKDHRRNMDRLYAARDAELSEAWRNK